MTSRRRWLIVAVGVLILSITPYAVSKIPVGTSSVSASTLLARVNASATVRYSGYAESTGRLGLPDVSQFGSLADLLGGKTDLRVWWRGGSDWRVDAVALTGETDVYQDAKGIWTWEYEGNQATRVDFATTLAIRLPRADDLVPGSLARRLLARATAAEVTRLPVRRIAGHDAAGLRMTPTEPGSTIAAVDVWAIPSSGLPLQVDVRGTSGGAVLSTAMLDVSTAAPPASDTRFVPASTVRVRTDSVTDIVSALDRFVQADPPAQLAGLRRAPGALGSVGLYGRGVTVLAAVPLPPRLADQLDTQLGGSGSGKADTVAFGPLELRLTAQGNVGTRWLLAGTVTAATLARAEAQLPEVQDFFR